MALRTPVIFAVLMLVCCLIPVIAAAQVSTTPEKEVQSPGTLWTDPWIQIMLVVIMVIGVVGSVVRLYVRGVPIIPRDIQFLGVALLIPLVGILVFRGRLPGEAAGTLLGAIVGYLLSGLGQEGRSQPDANVGRQSRTTIVTPGQQPQPTPGSRTDQP